MASTPHNSSRRVLGDLGVNKSLTPSKLTSPHTARKVALLDAPPIGTTSSPGKKRSIDEVDGAVVEVWRPGFIRDFMARRQEERERALSSVQEAEADPSNDDDTSSESAVNDDDVEPSIEDAASLELPANSSQSTIKNSQEDKEMWEAGEVATLPSSPPSQIIRPDSRAELLRLRLRVAMFKVQTNQTDVPLSRLQISPQKKSPQQSATVPLPPSTNPHSLASNQPQIHHVPRLLPAPTLTPTAYSSRCIQEPRIPHIPSSPPPSSGAEARMEVSDKEARPTTPLVAKSDSTHSPVQLSSPPASQERERRIPSASGSGSVQIGSVAVSTASNESCVIADEA